MRNINIIKIIPQGYCKGVICAIKTINNLLKDNTKQRPYYMLGKLVHNAHVTSAYCDLGIEIIDDYSNITKGTIIVTAHGLSSKKKKEIIDKGLDLVDTTCKEVLKIENNIREKIKDNYQIIYYGKINHPECNSILSIDNDIHLITSVDDIKDLNLLDNKIYFTNQTTMSYLDILDIVKVLKGKYNNIEIDIDICNASKTRQLALINSLNQCDMIIVVGDKNSNNTSKLKEICLENNKEVYLIENIEDINNIMIPDNITIGVTAGASTPNKLVDEVIKKLKDPSYQGTFNNLDYLSF